MRKDAYVADFETTTDPADVRVWAWVLREIETERVVSRGTCLDSFMSYIENKNIDIYFHNEKFDGHFIVSWLLSHGWKHDRENNPHTFSTLITDTRVWYNVSIVWKKHKKRYVKTNIFDSLKKLPFKVSQIAKAFKTPVLKGEIDYDKPRPVGYQPTTEEWQYIDNDTLIVAVALKSQRDQNMKAMTIGSDALKGFKATMGHKLDFRFYFPVLPVAVDDFIRRAYKGGWVYLNPRYKSKHLKGIVFDVNSLFPYTMYDCLLPYGKPIAYEGAPQPTASYPLYIQRLRCAFKLKEGKLPTIQLKGNGRFVETEYLTSSDDEIVEMTLSSVDLTLFLEHYEVYNLEYVGGFRFKASKEFFKKYIDYWMHIKETSKGALRALAKLMLNSLYGKFAMSIRRSKVTPYLDEDGILKGKLDPIEEIDPNYTALGVFITANARNITIRYAQLNYDRFIYADTDSLHLEGHDIPDNIQIHHSKIGAWKHEAVFDDSKFLRAKAYIEYVRGKTVIDKDTGEEVFEPCVDGTHTHNEWQVTIAGMPDNMHDQVTWENFQEGAVYNGKLRPKAVKGGVVLEETTFKIRGGDNMPKAQTKYDPFAYTLDVMRGYRKRLDLNEIKDDLRYIYGKDDHVVFSRWHSRTGQSVDHALEEFAQLTGHQFDSINLADKFVEFVRLHDRLASES